MKNAREAVERLSAVHRSSIAEFARIAREDLSGLEADLIAAVRAAWADAAQVAAFREALNEDDAKTILETLPMGARQ